MQKVHSEGALVKKIIWGELEDFRFALPNRLNFGLITSSNIKDFSPAARSDIWKAIIIQSETAKAQENVLLVPFRLQRIWIFWTCLVLIWVDLAEQSLDVDHPPNIRCANQAFNSAMGTLSCSILSRSRMVTALSSRLSKSTVRQ